MYSNFRTLALLVVLALGYYLFNPYWYGDGLSYAVDIKRGSWGSDPGHLFWRPVAYLVYSVAQSFSEFADPVITLQILSATGAALSVLGCYYLGLKFNLSSHEAVLASLTFAGSHFLLAYGGSGSAYAPAIGLILIAFVISLDSKDWRTTLIAAILFTAAVGVWAVSILLAPAFVATKLAYRKRDFVSGLRRTGYQAILVSALLVLLFVVAYSNSIQSETKTMVEWFSSSSHGIAARLSIINVARAALGLIITYISLGDFGFLVKQLVFGETLHSYSQFVIFLIIAAIFAIFALLAALGLAQRLRRGEALLRATVVVSVAFLPILFFAMLWQGSDVERFSLALPFLSILGVAGLSYFSRSSAINFSRVIALFVLISNICIMCMPSILTGGGLTTALGPSIVKTLGQNSILVVTGQELGPRIWVPTAYFHNVSVHSILYSVQTKGPGQWRERLETELRQALCNGGRVGVLSDLVGEATPGGIGLIAAEYPEPSMQQIIELFTNWKRGQSWEIGGFVFIEVIPPKDLLSLPCETSIS